jgi:hypothetical protein
VGGVRGRFQAMIDHVPGKSRKVIAKMVRGTMSHASGRMVQQQLEAVGGESAAHGGGIMGMQHMRRVLGVRSLGTEIL